MSTPNNATSATSADSTARTERVDRPSAATGGTAADGFQTGVGPGTGPGTAQPGDTAAPVFPQAGPPPVPTPEAAPVQRLQPAHAAQDSPPSQPAPAPAAQPVPVYAPPAAAAPTPAPAPAPQAPQALPAEPHPLDDPALQALAFRTLEAAELATRCAEDAARHAQLLEATQTQLKAQVSSLPKQQRQLLWIGAGLSVITFLVTGVTAIAVQTRVARLDATTLAVGKRAVDMNDGLKELGEVQKQLAEMQDRLAQIVANQVKVEQRLVDAVALAQQLPSQKQAESSASAASRQAQDIDRRLAAQAGAIRSLADQMKGLQRDLQPVQTLQRDVGRLLDAPRAKPAEPPKPAATAAAVPAFKGPVYPRVPPEGAASAVR